MPARPARASKLKVMGGRFVSAKSKTGDPKCSEAMSAKVNARLGNPVSMALDVANAILGKCRSAAHRLKTAGHQRAAGNEAKAQHQEAIVRRGGPVTAKDRAAKAAELRAKRSVSQNPATDQGRPSLREQVEAARAKKGNRSERLKDIGNKAERHAQNRAYAYQAKAISADRLKATASKGVLKDAVAESDRSKVSAIVARRRANAIAKANAPGGPKAAPSTIGGVSLREQAAAHRASKGTVDERAFKVRRKAAAHAEKLFQRASGVRIDRMPQKKYLEKLAAARQSQDELLRRRNKANEMVLRASRFARANR